MTLDDLSKLGPVATGLVAVFALVVGIFTIRQKQGADALAAQADRRDQWWKRAQWAIDRLYEPPKERQAVAWRVLQTLAESSLAGDEELAIFRAASANWFSRSDLPSPGSIEPDTGEGGAGEATEGEREAHVRAMSESAVIPSRLDVEAAQLWIITDRRLGKTTPEWVQRVAQGLPPVAPAH